MSTPTASRPRDDRCDARLGATFLIAGFLFAVTLAVAVISYYVVELPFLRKKEGSFFLRWRRQQSIEQPAEQRT